MSIKRSIERLHKKVNLFSVFAFASPAVATVIALVQLISLAHAATTQNVFAFLGSIIILVRCLMTLLPICGTIGLVCSILSVKLVKKQKRMIVAMVWNALLLLIGIVAIIAFLVRM